MIKRSDRNLRIAVILGITIISLFCVFPVGKKISLGLDLKGGMYVLLRADTSGIDAAKRADAVGAAVEKIRNRIDTYGVKETSIQVQGDNSILVQVPGLIDRQIVDALKGVGKLDFSLVVED